MEETKASETQAPQETSAKKPLWKEILKKAGLACFSLLLTFGVLEIAVRLFTKPVLPLLRSDREVGTVHMPNVARYVWNAEAKRDTFVRIGANGYVGDDVPPAKSASTTRIAFLGDSMTEGFQVDYYRTFVYLLEQALDVAFGAGHPVQLMNFGVGGAGTFLEYQTYKKNVAPYHPDEVVVMFHPNDFGDNLNKIQFDPEHYAEGAGRNVGLKSLLLHSALLRLVFSKLNGNPAFLTFLSKLGLYEYNKYTDETVKAGWQSNDVDPQFYAFTFDLMKRFDARVKADGGRFVVVMLPDEPDYAADGAGNLYLDKLAEFLKKEKIVSFDPTDALRQAKRASPSCLTYGCGGHMNDAGHRAMAATLYPFFEKEIQALTVPKK